ncbi:putative salt tolerance-like protein-like [Capsicum annuum]|nr:putative salt tolerance-like protein-like [Capsicum annuum]
MAKTRTNRRTLDSYTVKSISKTIRGKLLLSIFHFLGRKNELTGRKRYSAGDCVLMRPSESSKPSYVAKVEKIESDSRGGNVKVHVRWYYRPEESLGGRRQFHGSKELFMSDHRDIQSADTIEGKCMVHTFKSYTKLDAVGNDDFFCRFEYNSATGSFIPDRVAVYCKCEMPYNPDDLMVQCESCSDWYVLSCIETLVLEGCQGVGEAVELNTANSWSPFLTEFKFHPACIDMTPEEARRLDHFFCQNCSSEDQKKLLNPHATSRHSDIKVSPLLD